MALADILRDLPLSSGDGSGTRARLVTELLAHRAAEWDGRLTSQMLKELVSRYARTEKRLADLNRQLLEKQEELDADARAAAEIQRALLPSRKLVFPSVDFAWEFQPCELIGGDLFNVLSLDGQRLALFILDVSGHGVPAAMLTVSVSQALRPSSGLVIRQGEAPGAPLVVEAPAKVMEGLDREFPFERFGKFFTIFYGVLDTVTGELRYCNAGHPPPVLVGSDGTLSLLAEGGTIIGMGGVLPFTEGRLRLMPGDRMVMYTDGLVEFDDQEGNPFGEERLHSEIARHSKLPIGPLLDRLSAALRGFAGDTPLQDDITVLGVEYLGQGPGSGPEGVRS